jgi:Tol biopolymer transport system component
MADGSDRNILIADGRQPSAAPDGTRLVYARTTNQGAALLLWSEIDGSTTTLIPEGQFADVAYPQFSPQSDRIAFMAPQSGRSNGQPLAASASGLDLAAAFFGPRLASAHGIPWDPWVIDVDGSGLHRVAETSADEPSVTWSPDQTQLFVYSGTGSYVVDAASGSITALAFVSGYGPTVWLAGS